MERAEYHRLREQERTYWWHVGRRSLLAALLRWGVPADSRRPGLDIGCGTGENFLTLSAYGRFFGMEVTDELYRAADVRPDRPVAIARGDALPFADGSIGICTFFDVLEHIEDEDAFLRQVRRVLRPGGLVVLSVPAYMLLWSEHDVSLHHHRRYVRRSLRETLTRNGFDVVRATYAFASITPAVAVYRIFGRFFRRGRQPQSSYVRTPAPLNTLLAGVLDLEARLLAWSDLPFGTSVLAVARKGEA